jgi:hypothetical protein
MGEVEVVPDRTQFSSDNGGFDFHRDGADVSKFAVEIE